MNFRTVCRPNFRPGDEASHSYAIEELLPRSTGSDNICLIEYKFDNFCWIGIRVFNVKHYRLYAPCKKEYILLKSSLGFWRNFLVAMDTPWLLCTGAAATFLFSIIERGCLFPEYNSTGQICFPLIKVTLTYFFSSHGIDNQNYMCQ